MDLDSYCRRRLHLAGGSLLNRHSIASDRLASFKSVYFQPLDVLKARFERAGRQLVNFSNYDYAGLANDPRVKRAASDAIETFGIGAGASRLVGGHRSIHSELERDLAQFLGTEDALTLVSGYMTNVSLVGHLLTKNDLILVDDLSHNSIGVGANLSRARVIPFKHNNPDELERLLQEMRQRAGRVLIAIEGLYSMDGDIAQLPRFLEIKKRYDAWLMVDEAHCLGVLGPTGRGLAEHFDIDPKEIDIIVGTMSKTLSASGGFIAGGNALIDWLRFSLPAFVFSVGISPTLAAAVRECLNILQSEPWRVARLQKNSGLFLNWAKAYGLDTGAAIGAGIVSIMFADQRECMHVSRTLLDEGYLAPPILQLAVPKDKPRIRFFISAVHSEAELLGLVEVIAKAVRKAPPGSKARTSRRGPSPESTLAPVNEIALAGGA